MTAGAVGFAFPRRSTRRYTQVRPNRKIRHFGRDAEIQAMDGNKSVVQMLGSGNMPYRSFMFAVAGASVVAPSLPSLDAGFRHPCRKDGPPTFVYKDERRSMGTINTPKSAVCVSLSCARYLSIYRATEKMFPDLRN